MDILSILFLLLLGAAAGSWIGHYSGYREGLVKGKDAGVKEGMKEYMRKELIESKTIGGTYNVDALFKAREELQSSLKTNASTKKKTTAWSTWIMFGLLMLWAWQAFLIG
jgi:hypothetical protein